MDNIFIALVLSILEGLTEFLPVSSTGHLILAGDLLHFSGAKEAAFDVIIQLGAILAVVVLYWPRFRGLLEPQPYMRFSGKRGICFLILTTLPACVLGLVTHAAIKLYLFNSKSVLLALVAGSICMIAVEKLHPRPKCMTIDELTPGMALGIGFFQCLALWPGFSRSASTIMGGIILGARRGVAAEYSFIAAVPIMFAATGYDALKNWHLFSWEDMPFFLTGITGSFFSALLAIKLFMALISRVTLLPFAVYRLALACVFYLFIFY